jgi:UDP-N-acetylglucosamine--dolichyl-phosphate N-acetylglucosaminephosphotransferase
MELMDWIWLLIIFVFAFAASFFITWFLSKFFLKKGIYGHDVHKADKPKVAEMGGVGLVIVMLIVIIACIFIFIEYWQFFTVAAIVIFLVGLIGIWDDLKALGAFVKPFLLLIPSIPLIIWQLVSNRKFISDGLLLFDPAPFLPLIGAISITIVYWLLVPFAVTVLSNATNMLDVMNGSTPITSMFVAGTAVISTIVMSVQNKAEVDNLPGIVLSVLLFACLFAFFWFNKYPAKIFCGDTGSLTIGAMIALIAIFGRIEFIVIIAMMPQIMNSFQIIHSVRGLRERRDIKERPIKVLKNETIMANPKDEAPLTLTRWLVAKQPLTEWEIVDSMGVLSLISSLLGLITLALIYVSI